MGLNSKYCASSYGVRVPVSYREPLQDLKVGIMRSWAVFGEVD